MTPALDVRSRLRVTRAAQRAAADVAPSITKINAAQRGRLGTVLEADKARLRKLNPYMSQDFGASAIARSIAKQKAFRGLDVLTGQGDVLTRSMTPVITKALADAAGPLAAQETIRSFGMIASERTWNHGRPFITPRTRDTMAGVVGTALEGLAPQINTQALAAAAGAGRFDKGAYRGLSSGMFGPAARDTFDTFLPRINARAVAVLPGVRGFDNPAYAGLVSQISRGAFAGFGMPHYDATALAGYTSLSGFGKAALAGIMPRIDTRAVSALAGFHGVDKVRVAALSGSYFDRAGWGHIARRTLADLYPIVAAPGALGDELDVEVLDSPFWLPPWSLDRLPLDNFKMLQICVLWLHAVAGVVMAHTGQELSAEDAANLVFLEVSAALAPHLLERRHSR